MIMNLTGLLSVRRIAATTALVSVLALSACDETLMLMPGAIDPNDSCSQFQQGIVTAREEANALRVQNVVAGALVGAMAGAMLSAPEDRERNALLGAFLGGAAAGVATEQQQSQQRDADAALLRDVNTKAGTANGLLTSAGRNADSLRNCRQNQIRQLERDVRAGRVTTSDARSRLTVLQRRADIDNQIISASFNGIGNRVDSFVQTAAQSSGVQAAVIRRETAARTAAERSARNAVPNVARARTTQARLTNNDMRQRERIDRRLRAMDVLLSET